MHPASCTTDLCFDLAKAAGFHAGLAGFLAGVAFAAIVVLLERAAPGRPGSYAGLASFIGALISLIIASFLYGTAAGEELISERTALITLAAGVAWAAGVMSLFYGVAALVLDRVAGPLSEQLGRVIAFALPVVTYFYLAVSTANVLRLNGYELSVRSPEARVIAGLSGALCLFLVLVQIAWSSTKEWVIVGASSYRRDTRDVVILVVAVATSVVMALFVGGLLQFDNDVSLPPWILVACGTFAAIYEATFALLVRRLIHADQY
jgi:hypothetical protein